MGRLGLLARYTQGRAFQFFINLSGEKTSSLLQSVGEHIIRHCYSFTAVDLDVSGLMKAYFNVKVTNQIVEVKY